MASRTKRPREKREDEEARRWFGERITETTGEGLIITRLDGTRERIGKGGKLEPVKSE
jgi:hypothetical protein